MEIFKHFERIKGQLGKVFVITEVSYRNGLGAFSLNDNQIGPFIGDHFANFGECFFNGDVLIVNIEKCLIWAFHHEGEYAVFDKIATY